MTRREDGWGDLLDDLKERTDAATAMGGPERLARQAAKGRLNARERVARLCDEGTFQEVGALGGAQHPAGGKPVPADALVGGVARTNGRPVVVIAEDFTVQGGSIGHVNAAKRLRLAMLAEQERIPLFLLLDGAGERASDEDDALNTARRFLSYLPQHAGAAPPRAPAGIETQQRLPDSILDTIPANHQQPYDMRAVLEQLVDAGSLLEVQPLYGRSMVTAFARIGGQSVLIVANQPSVKAGTITADAAEKAAHFLRVAGSFGLPVVFLADNPGVMPGPEAERAGTLRAAAGMYLAQRAIRAPKVHVTLRKAFGFGSSLMAMNPFDRQTVTLAFAGVSLGGLPALGGAAAAKASDAERERMGELQSTRTLCRITLACSILSTSRLLPSGSVSVAFSGDSISGGWVITFASNGSVF